MNKNASKATRIFDVPERETDIPALSGKKLHMYTPPLSVWEDGDLAVPRHLADYCRSERDAGRKVLVHLRRDEWLDRHCYVVAMVQNGLHVACLPQTVPPRRWGTWIAETMADGTDVLLVWEHAHMDFPNPFSTVIFCGKGWPYTWSAVHDVWQRVWNGHNPRPVPVKAIFQSAPDWLIDVKQSFLLQLQIQNKTLSPHTKEEMISALLSRRRERV